MATQASDIRNLAVCGHGSSGKTTLVDKILMTTGAVKGPHSVDDGTSIADFEEEEKHHKHTIESSVTHFDYQGKHFNLVDTPGYPDFLGQTIGALCGVDNALIVVNAHAGVEINTRRTFQEAGKLGLGRMVVIDRMDDENVDYPKLVTTIQEIWGSACLPLNIPVGHGSGFKGVVSALKNPASAAGALLDPVGTGTQLLETIIEMDEAVTERYFEGTLPTDDELARLVIEAVAVGHLIPIVAVSGRSGVGLPELIDAVALCTVPATQIKRAAQREGQTLEITANAAGPLVAQVFKTRIDPFVQKLSFIRVFSGTLKKDDTIHASTARKPIKVGQIFRVQGQETTPVDAAVAGDIVALTKMEDLHTGTTLGDFTLPQFSYPTPMVGKAVTPKTRGDEAKLSGALHKIVEEDPTFHIDRDAQTKELVMTGLSELHLQLVQEKLKRRDKVEVDTKEPKIPYRETIQAEAEDSYRHKKQSGGRGQFGEVHIRMYPLPLDQPLEEFLTKERFPSMREHHYDPAFKFVWVDSIVGGTIPNNFLPAVEKGFKERLEKGVLAGYKIENVCVEVFYGKHHPVDSSEAAFKIAGSMAFRNVFRKANPSLMEPIVKMHITVPADKVGDVNSDMSGRRGRVLGLEAAGGGLQTVEALAPLAEVSTYARTLSSMTGGQGVYSMELSHYDVVPGNVMKEIVAKSTLKEDEEE